MKFTRATQTLTRSTLFLATMTMAYGYLFNGNHASLNYLVGGWKPVAGIPIGITMILDPFSGSGTTAVVAHKLNRNYTGIEISGEYVKESIARIQQSEGLPVEGEGKRQWNEHLDAELKWLYHENKIPSDRLIGDPYLLSLFTDKFNKRIGDKRNPFQPPDVLKHLVQLRRSAKLGPLRANIESLKGKKVRNRGHFEKVE